MTALDLKAHILGLLESSYQRLINDLNAIPEDKAGLCPGGCARSALAMVAECAAVNQATSIYLTTGEFPRRPKEEREAFYASFDTREKALTFLQEATEKLKVAVEGMDEATFGEMLDSPLGRPMSRFAMAEFPAYHMMYHDGQLNYIQSLYGDGDIHW